MALERDKTKNYLHYTALALFFIVLFLLQYADGVLPRIGGAVPVLLVPAVICAAMFVREWAGAAFGLAAGIFMDLSTPGATCFHAVTLMLMGCAAGLLITCVFNNNLLAALAFNLVFIFLFVTAKWFFLYYMAEYDSPGLYFIKYSLPDGLYTWVLSIPMYLLIRRIMKSMREKR